MRSKLVWNAHLPPRAATPGSSPCSRSYGQPVQSAARASLPDHYYERAVGWGKSRNGERLPFRQFRNERTPLLAAAATLTPILLAARRPM